MKALNNLKSQFKRKKKYQKDIPIEKALYEDNSEDIMIPNNQEIQSRFNEKESQRVLEEWKNGKIICGKWNIFQDDDVSSPEIGLQKK